MKYPGLPAAMWLLYAGSFRRQLTAVLGWDDKTAGQIMDNAKPKYKELIAGIPPFEKDDEFETNIVNCAMFSAIILNMPSEPSVEKMTTYYSASMMTGPTRLVCRMAGKNMFGPKDIAQRQKTAALKAADRNPYSWSMEYLPYADGSGYECRFDRCGICTLMTELGVQQYNPAMCHLDYDMNDATGTVRFVRKYTLASGGPYCDCGYKKKGMPAMLEQYL